MRIYWQSFIDRATNGAYFDRLSSYLNGIAAPGTVVEVFGMSPPDLDIGRLSEFRCSVLAVDNGLRAEEQGYDAVVIGHFQDPGVYELRSALEIPVIGTGEVTMHSGLQLGRRLGLVTLDPGYEVWHLEQAGRYGMASRVAGVAGLGLRPGDFVDAFAGDVEAEARMLADFERCAASLIARGADVILPAGVLPGLLLANHPRLKVGQAPVLNCASVALKSAEMWVQLRRIDGVAPSRATSFGLAPERVRRQFHDMIRHQPAAEA